MFYTTKRPLMHAKFNVTCIFFLLLRFCDNDFDKIIFELFCAFKLCHNFLCKTLWKNEPKIYIFRFDCDVICRRSWKTNCKLLRVLSRTLCRYNICDSHTKAYAILFLQFNRSLRLNRLYGRAWVYTASRFRRKIIFR